MQVNKSGFTIDNPAAKIVDFEATFEGITTAAGAVGGTTLVCSNIDGNYANMIVKVLDTAAAGQIRTISSIVAGVITVNAPFTNLLGAPVQIIQGTRFVILSFVDYTGISTVIGLNPVINMLTTPRYGFIEDWQGEPYFNEMRWTITNPATGVAWAIVPDGGTIRAETTPAASEIARLVCNQRYMISPSTYGINTITRKIILEWTFKLTSLANFLNTATFLGLTTLQTDTRASINLVGFGLIGAGNALQTITDNGGVETVNTGFGETLTNVNKFRIEAYASHVDFLLNETVIASHVTNLPSGPMYPNFYFQNTAGGTTLPAFGTIRLWCETIQR